MNDRLEDALRDALRRQDPPEGFAERVLARLGTPEPAPPGFWQRLGAWFRLPVLRVATAGALSVVLAAGVLYQHARQARAEAARRQVMVALRITSETLEAVREQVRNSSPAQQRIEVSPGILTSPKEKP